VLLLPPDKRMLVPKTPNPDIEKRSKEYITDYLINYVKDIKKYCDAKHWSLDYMDLAFVGGTSKIIQNEIKTVFGNNVYFPPNSEYTNVFGFLRRMCAKKLALIIPETTDDKTKLTQSSKENNKEVA